MFKKYRKKNKISDFFTSILPKNNNVKIVISEAYASFVLQCTVSGR